MIKRAILICLLTPGLTAALAGQVTPFTIPAIVRRAKGAVVLIEGTSSAGTISYEGTGFLVRSDGVTVTNYHVIANDASAVAKLPDGAFFPVEGVLAADPKRDIAILKLGGTGLRTISLGNSGSIQVGEGVVAIGNPLSLESTVSSGIVSGVREDASLGGLILQITAPISHGSSGGPLFDMHGRVIGITSMYLSGGEDLNFAIPIDAVKPLLRRASAQPQPLPGSRGVQTALEPPAPPPTAPPAGCTIAGIQRTPGFCNAYFDGYGAGWADADQAAFTVMRPTGVPSLYVGTTVSDNDGVGADFVYALRADVASSPLYSLAQDPSSADFEIDVVTVAPNPGTDTAGAVVISCGGSPKIHCGKGVLVDEIAFVAGSEAVDSEARNVMGRIDQAISGLPAQPPQ